MRRTLLSRTSHCAIAAMTAVACVALEPGPEAQSTTAAKPALSALWIEPPPDRDLFLGVGGRKLMPAVDEIYRVIEIKVGGFSEGYTVVDGAKREWSAKFPPEASTEVVASRLLWGLGYHQPPIYLLRDWKASGAIDPNPQRPARFRQKSPDLHGLNDVGHWSYADNPFRGTRQLQGLLVLQAMLGNSDLKDDNNALYELDEPLEGSRVWYVARDLGQTFGRTGVLNAPRGDIEVFEQTPFIRRVTGDLVELEYRGRHRPLFERIQTADVIWICQRLNRLSDQQWRDAFRAGGYDAALAARFITRLKAKIADGLQLAQPARRTS